MKAVILAGGQGKRLRPLTEYTPKPLIKICGKPIIYHQIEWLKSHGITDIILCVGYLKEKFLDEIGSGRKFGINVAYIVEDEALGTGGALKNASHVLRDEECFYVINGDIITNLNLKVMKEKLDDDVVGVIAAYPLPSPYGIIDVDENNRVVSFKEKPLLMKYWINAGVYLFKPSIFSFLPDKGDIEVTTFRKLAEMKLLKVVFYRDIFWKSIDTYKDIEEAERLLSKLSKS